MAIFYPDNLQHNNSNKYLVDITEVKGNSYPLGLLSETGSIPTDKRSIGQIIFVSSSQQYFGYYGSNVSASNWDNPLNWKTLSTFSGSFSGAFSGSFSGDGSGITGIISSSFASTASYLNTLNQDLTVNGNLTLNGTASISNLVINQVGYSSGSNQLGDASNDIQTLFGAVLIPTGSLSVSGSTVISGSLTASGLNYPLTDNGEESFIQTDGNGQLSLQYVKTIYEEIVNGEFTTLIKGTPVYVSGSVGAASIVYRADAGIPSKLPVVYISADTLGAGEIGRGIALGLIKGVDTTGYPAGTEIYLAVGGGWTSTRPTGSATIQVLGYVTKEGNGGQGVVLNPGPVILPNLAPGNVWVGNTSSLPIATLTSSLSVARAVSSSFASTASFITPLDTNAFVRGGNSFGTQALLGTNDNNNLAFETSGSIRMFVSSSGNIGIGTTSPSARLHIINTGQFLFNTNNLQVASSGLSAFYYNNTINWSSALTYTLQRQGGVVGIHINTSDNVGIGTTSVSSKLQVRGSGATSSTTALRVENSNASASLVVLDNGFVGIGKTNPLTPLDVVGYIQSSQGYKFSTSTLGQVAISAGNSYFDYEGNLFFRALPGYGSTITLTSTGNVGIGTTSPSASLHISGASSATLFEIDSTSTNNVLFVSGSGRIGIGTGAPLYSLDVNGNGRFVGNVRFDLGLRDNRDNTFIAQSISSVISNRTLTIGNATYSNINFPNGNVGIGTTTPINKLHVSGNVLFEHTGSTSVAHTLLFRNDNNAYGGITIASSGQALIINQASGFGYLSAAGFNIASTNSSIWTNNGSILDITNALGTINYFRIANTTGNIGIGITSPTSRLQVRGSGATASTTALRIENSNASASLVVLDSGNVGIGTTTPTSRLDVSGSAHFKFTAAGTDQFVIDGPGANRYFIAENSNGFVGIGSYTTSILPTVPVDIRGNTSVRGSSATTGNAFIITNSTPTTLLSVGNNSTSQFTGLVGINRAPTSSLDITGTTRLSGLFNTAASGSILTVIGSGSAQPIFTVQGSQGELFSITDSLSGSLFSVNDISGLPIMEVFSDNTILMGDYQDPMLLTTRKITQTNSGSFIVYSIPTGSYDGAFIEYTIKSGSNARAGTIMSTWVGSSIEFTETTTMDIGNTTAVGLTMVLSGSNAVLTGSSSTGSWISRFIIRAI
jgi:hypothetical protein